MCYLCMVVPFLVIFVWGESQQIETARPKCDRRSRRSKGQAKSPINNNTDRAQDGGSWPAR